jgi:integrase
MLVSHKEAREEMKAFLGSKIHDYGIILAFLTGAPIGETQIRKKFGKLIRDNNLPEVVFHSLRHSSVTYCLKECKCSIAGTRL